MVFFVTNRTQPTEWIQCLVMIKSTYLPLPCIPFDGLHCGWSKWKEEGEGRSCPQEVEGGVLDHLHLEGGAYPSSCLAGRREKKQNEMPSEKLRCQ